MFTIINNTGVCFTYSQRLTIQNKSLEWGINCVMLIQDEHEPNVFDVLENGNEYGYMFAFDQSTNSIIPELSENCR